MFGKLTLRMKEGMQEAEKKEGKQRKREKEDRNIGTVEQGRSEEYFCDYGFGYLYESSSFKL